MKYTIIHINDRAEKQMEINREILKDFEHVNSIDFFDARRGNAWDVLNHLGIKQDVWSPYDGRTTEMSVGEHGIWVSTINCLKYASTLNEPFLVLEDDIALAEDFVERLAEYLSELPSDYDFLSLYFFNGHNDFDTATDIGKNSIHKSLNQFSGAQAILYSPKGAKKILTLVRRLGLEYTADCFIYRMSLLGIVDGFSIKPDQKPLLRHLYKEIPSSIDPTNLRMVEM